MTLNLGCISWLVQEIGQDRFHKEFMMSPWKGFGGAEAVRQGLTSPGLPLWPLFASTSFPSVHGTLVNFEPCLGCQQSLIDV